MHAGMCEQACVHRHVRMDMCAQTSGQDRSTSGQDRSTSGQDRSTSGQVRSPIGGHLTEEIALQGAPLNAGWAQCFDAHKALQDKLANATQAATGDRPSSEPSTSRQDPSTSDLDGSTSRRRSRRLAAQSQRSSDGQPRRSTTGKARSTSGQDSSTSDQDRSTSGQGRSSDSGQTCREWSTADQDRSTSAQDSQGEFDSALAALVADDDACSSLGAEALEVLQ